MIDIERGIVLVGSLGEIDGPEKDAVHVDKIRADGISPRAVPGVVIGQVEGPGQFDLDDAAQVGNERLHTGVWGPILASRRGCRTSMFTDRGERDGGGDV